MVRRVNKRRHKGVRSPHKLKARRRLRNPQRQGLNLRRRVPRLRLHPVRAQPMRRPRRRQLLRQPRLQSL